MERSDSISLPSIEAQQPQGQVTDKNETKDNSQNATIAASHYPSGIKYYLAIATLCLAIFLVTLDSTIIATATPYISDDFHSLGDVGWYSSVYTMVICTTQLLFGKLLARYSVRWIYSISMLFFLVGSAVCGAAPNSHSLIIGRAIAGVGCSGLLVAAFSLVPILVAPAKRPILLGLLSGSRGLATTFGPLIGGVLTEKVSWRWNFYINLPIGAVIQIAFFFLVHPPKRDHEAFTSWTEFLKTLDLFGLVALLPSIVCLLLALQWGGLKYAWQDARVIVLLVLAGIFAIAFISVEIWQGPNAMLPSRVFTQRTVSAASFFGFCTVSAIFVLTYYLPIWFQGVKSATPIQSGVWTLPWVITSTIISLAGGILMSKVGHPDIFMGIAIIFGAVGSGLFTTFTVDTPTGEWIGYQIIFAISSSLCSVTPLMVAQHALPLKDIPIGSGLVMFSQTVGASIFVAVAQALFTNELSAGLEGTAVGDDGLDVSGLLSGGISTLTEGLSGEGKRGVLVVLNEALTRSWQLAVVLECVAVIGVLAVVQGMRMKRVSASTS
ncbi:MFS general substrate transporter [Aspergillus eucalypticola CBS 122712]|uniref:MFS general substrate transporter n=1 Tax=Aspergillus eucalypticola (strain CBS 122712 / IBT 29274) TaxID=1448314 RepID=A0A317W7Y2_ASPEC|nr:MFS general substrate transporter [Aspergillus eucalypticola CBS 122712]PWY81407.1 MFS general substrate transporter [Aspergillus eucalypticola CBS 122712]